MSYQALLFCPDEKTARVVSQVLSELEFKVEPCHEPFAAVKKLMVQHFDALVVDCDNEQNAALLFKSARNSGSNQTSLAVAVVEGQTGVAKAFRLGANLVLTKPIHVEQSKGTLRVARGLLRKGQAAKSAAAAPSAAPPTMFAQPSVATPFPPPQKVVAPPSIERFRFRARCRTNAGARSCRRRVARVHAGLPDLQRREFDAFCGRIRSVQAVSLATAQAPGGADGVRPAPRLRKPRGNPSLTQPPRVCWAPRRLAFRTAVVAQTSIGLGRTGAAAAPARAKEIPAPDAKKLGLEPTASAIAAPSTEETEIKRIEDPSAGDGWDSNSASAVTEAPSLLHSMTTQASDCGWQQEDTADRGRGARTGGGRLFRLDQDAVRASPAAVPQSAAPANPETSALPPQPRLQSQRPNPRPAIW